jgi:hypothetical protein
MSKQWLKVQKQSMIDNDKILNQYLGFFFEEFDSGQGQEIFLLSIASRPALGPTHPPIKCVPGFLPLGTAVEA